MSGGGALRVTLSTGGVVRGDMEGECVVAPTPVSIAIMLVPIGDTTGGVEAAGLAFAAGDCTASLEWWREAESRRGVPRLRLIGVLS